MQGQRVPSRRTHLQLSTPEPFCWFRGKIGSYEGQEGGRLLVGPPWEFYNARTIYEKAQKKHDPLLSPHGFFRRLANHNDTHAREFIERFGPLIAGKGQRIHPLGPPPLPVEVNLEDFWLRHIEFTQTMCLWENRNSKKELEAAWRNIAQNYPLRRDVFDPDRSGLILPWDLANEGRVLDSSRSDMHVFEEWAKNTSFEDMRRWTVWLVRSELNSNTAGSRAFWDAGWDRTGEKFRQVVMSHSLWSMMWELFGFDTTETCWRRCPHCQRLFYPKRRDQLYCTSRQQGLASKRAYAARRRAEERKMKTVVARPAKGGK